MHIYNSREYQDIVHALGVKKNLHPCRQLRQLNLIPFSEAWDTSYERNENYSNERDTPKSKQSEPFSLLVKKLGCHSFDSQGRLLHSAVFSSIDERNSSSNITNDSTKGAVTPKINLQINDNRNCYRLYLATHIDDLPPIAQLTIDVFDATAITLSSTSDWSAWEQALVGTVVKPAIGIYNAYANVVAYTEVLMGLRKRMRNRIFVDCNGRERGVMEDENVDIHVGRYDWLAPLVVSESSSADKTRKESTVEEIAARSSLILTLARPSQRMYVEKGEKIGVEGEIEVVATVELRLQPTDAKIPFSQPWLDTFERRLALLFSFMGDESSRVSATNKSVSLDGTTAAEDLTEISPIGNCYNAPLRPYLCNLCVAPSLRSLGIGRAMVRIVEAIAHQKWGYSHLYLHVDPSNEAARTLYEKEGYVDVGRRWNVIWARGANDIGYYMKVLGGNGI